MSTEITNSSGIYCVYRGTYNGKKVNIKQLLYIGEPSNVQSHLNEHVTKGDWKKYLKSGERFIYSVEKVSGSDTERAETALIYERQPICNE